MRCPDEPAFFAGDGLRAVPFFPFTRIEYKSDGTETVPPEAIPSFSAAGSEIYLHRHLQLVGAGGALLATPAGELDTVRVQDPR